MRQKCENTIKIEICENNPKAIASITKDNTKSILLHSQTPDSEKLTQDAQSSHTKDEREKNV